MSYFTHEMVLSSRQKQILGLLIKEELKLYNTLNSALDHQLKTNHMGLMEVVSNLRLYGECIEHNISVRDIDMEEIPVQLEGIANQLAFLSDNALKVLDTAVIKSNVDVRTKRNLGVELFRYYADQSSSYDHSGKQVKVVTSLPHHEYAMKRHVQIHRKAMKVIYNKDQNVSIVKTAYFPKGIIVRGNINMKRWSVMIIHQTPFVDVNYNTPWRVELQDTQQDYILNFVDSHLHPKNYGINRSVKF